MNRGEGVGRTAREEAREELDAGEREEGPDGAEDEEVDGRGRRQGRGGVVPVGNWWFLD